MLPEFIYLVLKTLEQNGKFKAILYIKGLGVAWKGIIIYSSTGLSRTKNNWHDLNNNISNNNNNNAQLLLFVLFLFNLSQFWYPSAHAHVRKGQTSNKTFLKVCKDNYSSQQQSLIYLQRIKHVFSGSGAFLGMLLFTGFEIVSQDSRKSPNLPKRWRNTCEM